MFAIRNLLLLLVLLPGASVVRSAELELPAVALAGVDTILYVTNAAPGEALEVQLAGEAVTGVADAHGRASLVVVPHSSGRFDVRLGANQSGNASASLRVIPGILSVLPPIVAIAVALLLRNVLPALVVGLWLGATTLHSFTPRGAYEGLLDSFQRFVIDALANPDHAAIIAFSMMMGGLVGIVTRNGGMAAIVRRLVSRAKSAASGQVSVWALGLVIFFDDYSNTLVVGNTARALTDRLRISREKLAYLVDSTAAPVVCIALATTWIGYEVGLIDASIQNIDGIEQSAYAIFLGSIPFSFYPILAIMFVLAVAASGRDFGPMLAAERRARGGQVRPPVASGAPALQGENLEAKPGIEGRASDAVVPIVTLIGVLLGSLYVTGSGETFADIIGSADSYKAMSWASFVAVLVAATMSLLRRSLTTHEVVDAWYAGVRATLFAMIVLVLAWALSSVTEALHTADYLVSILASNLSPSLLPAAVFLLSAITAFTTGTSWGTMGILMPLVIPLAWAVMLENGLSGPEDFHLLYSAIACNLAGAVWGDHCSPISDTTILSSMASGCDHIEHVRTQLPYAGLVGAVALLLCTVPAGFGWSPWLLLPVALALLLLILRLIGRRADDSANAPLVDA